MFGFDLTIDQAIAFWGAVISAVIMAATIAQVVVAYLISRSIRIASEKTEAVHASRDVNAMWQEYNRLCITDREFRRVAKKLSFSNLSDEEFQLHYIIFMNLNVIHIAYHANTINEARNGQTHLSSTFEDLLIALLPHKEILLSILKGGRGYDPEFVQAALKLIEGTER